MYELQPRGTDAAGIAVINDPSYGVDSVLFKKPLQPHRIVKRPKFEEALGQIGPHTNFIMLHARATTVGSTADNYNNHPILARPIVGIHNGTLYNDDRLFKKFSEHITQEGSVDSEVIFRLYHYFTDQMSLSPKHAMAATAEQLWGAYTGALVDLRAPNRMVMFKHPVWGVGIHNGTLYNDDRLFKKFSEHITQEGSVDSEVIFRLYHYFTDQMSLSPKHAMAATAEQLWGAYTGALVDLRAPNRMVMFKHERSLALLRLVHYDIVIAISEVRFYDAARKRLGLQVKDDYQIVHDETGFIVDVNTSKRITDKIVDFALPVKKTTPSMLLSGQPAWLRSGFCG